MRNAGAARPDVRRRRERRWPLPRADGVEGLRAVESRLARRHLVSGGGGGVVWRCVRRSRAAARQVAAVRRLAAPLDAGQRVWLCIRYVALAGRKQWFCF